MQIQKAKICDNIINSASSDVSRKLRNELDKVIGQMHTDALNQEHQNLKQINKGYENKLKIVKRRLVCKENLYILIDFLSFMSAHSQIRAKKPEEL